MVEAIITFLRETFSPQVGVLLAGALPVTELRAAIPLGISLGMAPREACLYALVGNMLPIPFLLILLPRLMRWFSKGTWLGRKLDWWTCRTLRRSDSIRKYGPLGLVLFTAIPLPSTGAWSASLAAVVLGISPRLAFASIALGVVIAGAVVTLLSVGLLL